MAGENHGAVGRGIERIFNQGSLTGLSEGQLLRRFAAGDEAAFEILVTRHGPTVLGVCRRMLADARDVEDAFQATFLVLLKKAGGLRDPEAIRPWLYGVSCRVAARIRAGAARRRAEERKGARQEVAPPDREPEQRELRAMIDEEIQRLPEKYRRPVVLCYVEGRTHEEAARRLHCTAGSLRGRLDRARKTLQDRLVRRGVAPAAGLAALAAGGEASAAIVVPAPLVAATAATLARAATAGAVASASSGAALELADRVARGMMVAKIKVASSFLAAAAILLAAGTAWLMLLDGSVAREDQDGRAPVAAPIAGQGQPEGPSIALSVVDQRTGKPLPGVEVAIEIDRNPRGFLKTDDSGRAEFKIPSPAPQILGLSARKAGFAAVTLWFPSPIREEEVPASYTLKMYPAGAVEGVVRDEQGRPVAGVRVAVSVWTNSAEIRYLREGFGSLPIATSDAEGRWRCSGVPAGIDPSRVSIRFTHPDYEVVDLPTGQALADVRAGKPTVLPRGLEVTGRVVDPSGRPVRGARVVRGSDASVGELGVVETDKEGRFRFDHAAAGETVLTVQAPGFAPALQKVVARPGLAPMEFRIEKGRIIRGRVVDAKDQPIAGASVIVDGWRGQRTLARRMTTDEDGAFQWADAPPDSFWINVSHEGYLPVYRREVPPAGGEPTIALARQFKVRGTVVDAATRHAIRAFTLVPGTESGEGFPPYWDRSRARTATRGRYFIEFGDQSQPEGRRLRIEADGYMPAISRVIRDDETDPVVNFVLEKAAGITGVARRPDGTPLAGADVVLVSPSQPAFLTNGRPPAGRDHRIVKTGSDGRFAFPPQEPPYTIVVLHEGGFAEHTVRGADAPPPPALTVRPWARVEGTFRIGRRPGAGESLDLGYARTGDTPTTIPWWSGEATTDAAGRFAFERVMPGEVTITRRMLLKRMASSQSWGASHSTRVDVAPGTTTRVEVGGTGRPVVGKVAAPAGPAGPIDWTFSMNNLIPRPTPGGVLDRLGLRKGPRRAAMGCTIKLEADGSFRAEDVEAGTYELLIMINRPPKDPFAVGIGGDAIATARREVVVPAIPGGRSDEPLDVGTITVEAVKTP